MAPFLYQKYSRVFIMIGITALSVSAGYVGGLSGQQYIDYWQQLVFPQHQIQKPSSSGVLPLPALVANTSPSIVALYRLDDNNIKDAISPLPSHDSYVGDAIAVSADGWLIVPTSLMGDEDDKQDPKSLTSHALIYKQQVYSISDLIVDPVTSVSFVKINAVGLKPASFAWEQSMVGNSLGYHISSDGTVVSLYIGQPRYPLNTIKENYLAHTNSLAKRSNPDIVLPTMGAPVVIETGGIIGISDSDGIIPSYGFRSSLDQALSARTLKRTTLDISYYDNAWIPHTIFVTPALTMTGATIVNPGSTAGSDPSQGLQKGDVVVHINNENLDVNRSFSDVLNQYNPGDTVRIGLQRKGESITISLTLK